MRFVFFFFKAKDGIRYLFRSRGLGDVYKRQPQHREIADVSPIGIESPTDTVPGFRELLAEERIVRASRNPFHCRLRAKRFNEIGGQENSRHVSRWRL